MTVNRTLLEYLWDTVVYIGSFNLRLFLQDIMVWFTDCYRFPMVSYDPPPRQSKLSARECIGKRPPRELYWVESRWRNPQKVVYMDPYIQDILGVVPSTLNPLYISDRVICLCFVPQADLGEWCWSRPFLPIQKSSGSKSRGPNGFGESSC